MILNRAVELIFSSYLIWILGKVGWDGEEFYLCRFEQLMVFLTAVSADEDTEEEFNCCHFRPSEKSHELSPKIEMHLIF